MMRTGTTWGLSNVPVAMHAEAPLMPNTEPTGTRRVWIALLSVSWVHAGGAFLSALALVTFGGCNPLQQFAVRDVGGTGRQRGSHAEYRERAPFIGRFATADRQSH